MNDPSSSQQVFNVQNEHKKRKLTPERAKANYLLGQLRLRLQYAKLKVEHGWQRQNLNEVENLYFRRAHMHRPLPTISPGGRRSQRSQTTPSTFSSLDDLTAEHSSEPEPQAEPDRQQSSDVNQPGPVAYASPSSEEVTTANNTDVVAAARIYPSPPDTLPSPTVAAGTKRKRTPTIISLHPTNDRSSITHASNHNAPTDPPIASGSGLGLMQPPLITPTHASKSEFASNLHDADNGMHIYSHQRQHHALSQSAPFSQMHGNPRSLSTAFSPHLIAAPSGGSLTYDAFWSSLSTASQPRHGVRPHYPSHSGAS